MRFPPLIDRFAARELADPAGLRAVRATVAFMVPILLSALGLLPEGPAVLAAFAGQSIGLVDVRGAYPLRLTLLWSVAAVLALAAWLGGATADHEAMAVLAAGLLGLAGGLWRHALREYGPSVAASSCLLFFVTLALGPGIPSPGQAALAAFAGAAFCILIQAFSWPFLAQHPLRRSVAEAWSALADLAEALPAVDGEAAGPRAERLMASEARLREALDQAAHALERAPGRSARPLLKGLQALNDDAAHLATQITALDPILERLMEPPGPGPLAASFRSLLASLMNISRSLAVAVVSHQAGHVSRFEVRCKRLEHLLRVVRDRVRTRFGDSPEGAHAAEVLDRIQGLADQARADLRASVERFQQRGPISFELLDLRTWTLRPLASTLDFSLDVDPALVRFALRLAVMLMAGTFVYRHWHLVHGYWITLCIVVVLQPDFGATRVRATQRVVGTVGGALLGSLLLYLHLPRPVLLAGLALAAWAFTYEVKRRYAVAVFFITLMVVLQVEASGPLSGSIIVQRLGLTALGSLCALLAALAFWPLWERDRFPPLLAAALRANQVFLERLCLGLGGSPTLTPALVLKAKRRAQRAGSQVFGSLNRMAGDPDVMQEGLERAAALANHSQRITRGLGAAAVHYAEDGPRVAGLEPAAEAASRALEDLAHAVEGEWRPDLGARRAALEAAVLPEAEDPRSAWVLGQLDLVLTELSATLVEYQGP